MKKNNKKIIKIITEKRETQISFSEIIKDFPKKIEFIKNPKNRIDISHYFGKGKGIKESIKCLTLEKKFSNISLGSYHTKGGKEITDFKGLYVFFHGNNPFYVGISKKVVHRIQQHVKGNSHFTSTLAYKIGTILYEMNEGKPYLEKRKEFDFRNYVKPAKGFLMCQDIVFIQIDNDDELAIFEIYCSMELGTTLNTFETH